MQNFKTCTQTALCISRKDILFGFFKMKNKMRNIEIWITLYFQKGLEKYRLEKTPNESHRLA